MTLDRIKRGQVFKIISISDELTRVQAIRFGFTEGSTATCAETVPAGPVVLRKDRQEIAIGRGLAGKITVALQ
ncbi:MAG: iron transporter [Peptococcaceae bacterium BRH_c8a]|nr:MAG: iron transporter [Peptococcaceae bacterium BRH_c8a]